MFRLRRILAGVLTLLIIAAIYAGFVLLVLNDDSDHCSKAEAFSAGVGDCLDRARDRGR